MQGASAVIRSKKTGLIRCDMPDGTTQYITDEKYVEVLKFKKERDRKKNEKTI